jgi:hypothetical protein
MLLKNVVLGALHAVAQEPVARELSSCRKTGKTRGSIKLAALGKEKGTSDKDKEKG